ncbi:MAG TPA: GGDEF domain-containing protein, partial [Kineosporiaceae bacterium]|nr:GGDEF domain-containing protein [Kineosporiaceae bacterium]
VLQLMSAVASGIGVVVDPAFRHSGLAPWATAFDLASGLWVLWRGLRLGDLTFLAALIGAQIVAVTYLAQTQVAGSVISAEGGLLCPTIIAAAFCSRRWHVVVQTVAAMAGIGCLAWLRLGGTGDFAPTVLGEVFTFVVVAVVVRLLRDLAHDALVKAQRGEVTDPLTGLSNRRGLERSGQRSWQNQARICQPIAVLILDIDRFKEINDRHGHAAGDEVIRQVAARLNAHTRRDDVVVRLGGEEFLVLAPGVLGEGAATAERLRAAIERELRPVTVSVGVYEASPGLADQLPESLWCAVNVADSAMYNAKRSGRNRVVKAADTPSPAGRPITTSEALPRGIA